LSIVALKQSAVIGPTPGTVMNLRTCASWRASLARRRGCVPTPSTCSLIIAVNVRDGPIP
jgi:hypothetical protein